MASTAIPYGLEFSNRAEHCPLSCQVLGFGIKRPADIGLEASARSSAIAAAAAQPVTRLTTMIYIRWPRSVDGGLQLGSPLGIGLGTAPHLVGTNAHLGNRLLERHALTKQVEQRSPLVGRELLFSLHALPLPLDRRTRGLAM